MAMNSSSERLPFDPHLKLLAQSLVEFRTGFSENDYLEVVGEIARHLNLSHKPNCLLLAEKDSSRHLLKYLLEHYQEQAPFLPVDANPFNARQQEIISYLNKILIDEHKAQNGRLVAASALGNLGQVDERIITVLLTALKDGDYHFRETAATELGNLKQADERVITALLTALMDDVDDVRKAAASALGNFDQADERVITALLTALMVMKMSDG